MKFKPAHARIQFASGSNSEWFHIKESDVSKFLTFCDTKVQLDTNVPPVWGTKFGLNSVSRVIFPYRRMVTGVGVVDGKAQRIRSYRETNNTFAKNLRVRTTQYEIEKMKKDYKKLRDAERQKLVKSPEFWAALLVGKKFVDPNMYAGDPGHFDGRKVITGSNRKPGFMIRIEYEPDLSQEQDQKATQKGIDDSEGELNVNEILEYFPALKRKYRDSYEYYVYKNKFEDDADYTATFQGDNEPVAITPPKPKKRAKNVNKGFIERFIERTMDDGQRYLGYIESVGTAQGRDDGLGDNNDQIYANVVYIATRNAKKPQYNGAKEQLDDDEIKQMLVDKRRERFVLPNYQTTHFVGV